MDLVKSTKTDVDLWEALAARCARDDQGACQELGERLWPVWLRILGSSRTMGRFSRSEDDVRNVAVTLLAKIASGNRGALRTYAGWRERNVGKTFEDWMRIVMTNAAREYVSDKLGPPPKTGDLPSAKRLLNEFASSIALDTLTVRPPFTAAETARRLLEFAQAHLPEDQHAALALWLTGSTFPEIGEQLKTSADQAQRTLRAALATLRRYFAPPPDRRGERDEHDRDENRANKRRPA